MPEIEENKNSGLLIVPLSPKAFVFGAESGVAPKERLPKGDWHKYTPTGEYQSIPFKYDTMSCTTFSGLNSLEEQANFLKETEMTAEQIELCKSLGYIDEKGSFNFNDWFSANMSGTMPNGNDFGSVWESFRKHGVIGQKKGYQVGDFKTITEWLDRTKVTTEHKNEGLKFLDIFEIEYEFILLGVSNPEIIAQHLKHAPIHIGTPVCSGWNKKGKPVQKCDLPIQHATLVHGSVPKKVTQIFDHYDPLNKELAWDYSIPYAVKGVLKLRTAKPKPVKPQFVFTKTLSRNVRDKEVMEVQKFLKFHGFYKLDYFTDFYGYWTELAVKEFQKFYAKDILHPIGLTLPTGKWASMSIKKANILQAQS